MRLAKEVSKNKNRYKNKTTKIILYFDTIKVKDIMLHKLEKVRPVKFVAFLFNNLFLNNILIIFFFPKQ